MKFSKVMSFLSLCWTIADSKKDFLPKGRPFQVLQSEISNLEGDIALLSTSMQTLGDELTALTAQVSSNTESIENLELGLIELEDSVSDNTADIATLEATATALQTALDGVRTDLTTLTADYTSKVAEIEQEIIVLGTDINTILTVTIPPLVGDVAAVQAELVRITSLEQQVSALETFKESYETLVADLTTKVENMEDFDERIKFLLSLNGLNEEKICLWDYNGGCQFRETISPLCSSRYAEYRYTTTRSKELEPVPLLPVRFEVHMVATYCSGSLPSYTVKLNGSVVGTISFPYTCSCSPPDYSITISTSDLETYFLLDQPNVVTVVGTGVRLEAEYYAVIEYSVE